MSDQILVEFKSNMDQLIAESKSYQTELKAAEQTGVKGAENISKSVDKATASTRSLKAQLKDLKAQIASSTDPKEIQRLSKAAGELSDKINDASESVKVFSSGSKFEQINNAFGSIVSNVRNLDFSRAAEQSKVLLGIVKSITFAEAIQGVKALGTVFLDLGKALLTNPVTLLAAAIAGLVYVIYDAVGAFSDFSKSSQTLNDSLKETESRVTKLGQKQAEYLVKLAQAQGKLTKSQADAKLIELKNFDERTERVRKFSEDVKKLADELGLSLADAKGGKFSEVYGGDYKDLLNRKKFNSEFIKLQQSLRQELSFILKNQVTEQAVTNQETANAIQKQEQDNADKIKALRLQAAEDLENQNKTLRDLRTGNIQNEFEREKQLLKDKLDDDLKSYDGNGALIAERRIKYVNDYNNLVESYRRKEIEENDKANALLVESNKNKVDAIQKQEDDFEEATRQRNQRILEDGVESMKKEFEARKKLEQDLKSAVTDSLNSIGTIVSNINQGKIDSIGEAADREKEIIEKQYKDQLITKEQYEAAKSEVDKKAQAEESRLKRQTFEINRNIALIEAGINVAQGVTKALASAPPPGNFALAALVAAAGLAQIGAIISQPTPKFEKGGKVKGKRHSTGGEFIEAEEGEWIIKRDEALKHDRMLRAVNDGQAESFIRVHYIAPALKEQQRKMEKAQLFVTNNARSFTDKQILESLKDSRKSEKENFKMLAQIISSKNRSSHKW